MGFKRQMPPASLYSLSQRIEEMVADKGYYSGAAVVNLQNAEVRTHIPEKKQRGQSRGTASGLCEPEAS